MASREASKVSTTTSAVLWAEGVVDTSVSITAFRIRLRIISRTTIETLPKIPRKTSDSLLHRSNKT